MKKHAILLVLSIFGVSSNSFAQSTPNFFSFGKLGVHSDIPNEQVSFGGGAGFGMNLSNQPNRWQTQLNLDYFSLNSGEVARNGFRSFSMMFQFGRIWSRKLKEKTRLGIGGGVVGVIPLKPKENPSFMQNALPAVGLYIRFEYPISLVHGKNMHLIMDNSVFGDGFMRNVVGLSYPLGKKSD